MKGIILIMDDDPTRLTAMSSLVAVRYPAYEIVEFDNAPDTIGWLKNNLSSLALMSLDHDLGINRERNGEVFDPGIGRDVVNYLVTQVPTCLVILHTTNYMAREGMIFALENSNWRTSYVAPHNDLEWIQETWGAEIEKYLN